MGYTVFTNPVALSLPHGGHALCGNAVAAAHDKAFLAPEGENDGGENSAVAEGEREERRMLNKAKLRFPVRNEQECRRPRLPECMEGIKFCSIA